jgi:hypothetical protein
LPGFKYIFAGSIINSKRTSLAETQRNKERKEMSRAKAPRREEKISRVKKEKILTTETQRETKLKGKITCLQPGNLSDQ